ncbi:MAG: type II toxin-antitoxin system VapC family toxin [Acidimicrobiaceae bacterium]|nr:type II toxin-antitoxin system VapC family toxin [Acidimicrobiaceae bacterium]
MIVTDASWVVALRDPSDGHHLAAAAVNRGIADEDVWLHPVTFAECLVAPARLGVLSDAVLRLRAAFEIPEVDRDAPVRWAALRTQTGLRLPDAVVLDTALSHRARAVVTFDAKLAEAATEYGLEIASAWKQPVVPIVEQHGLPK